MNLNCEKCRLKYGYICIDIVKKGLNEYWGDDCSSRSFVRTEVGNFYTCPQNRESPPGTPGWFPGRGW